MRKKMIKMKRKQITTFMILAGVMSLVITLQMCYPVFADENNGTQVIQTGFNTIYGLIAAIVSSIGSLYLLWGVFEWAQSMNMQDGGAQSMAFKRIAGGLVDVITPQLIPVITASVGA